MFKEACSHYTNSMKHKFDGSGLSFISNLRSTFPNATWSDSRCKAYDVSQPTHQYVRTTWNFTSGARIQQVCGYIKGFISPQFQTTAILQGNQTYFTDTSFLSSTISYKRVYCVFVFYVFQGQSLQGFECSVGLFYVSSDENLSYCESELTFKMFRFF